MRSQEAQVESGLQGMAEDEGVPINERRVGHLPGDRVRVEIGFFRREMNLKDYSSSKEVSVAHNVARNPASGSIFAEWRGRLLEVAIDAR